MSVPFARIVVGTLLFAAFDTWLGPFHFACGRASGAQSSFYLYLGRP